MAAASLAFALVLVCSLLGHSASDFASDQAECTDSLAGLSVCLQYVSGSAQAPTSDCCKGLAQVVQKSKRCLCILVKDRDNPNLGLKINATRALTLPATCNNPTSISECIELLHLSPNSTDAKIFKQFDGSTTPTPTAPSTEQGNSTQSNSDRSTGGSLGKASSGRRKEQNMAMNTLLGLSFWCLIWLFYP